VAAEIARLEAALMAEKRYPAVRGVVLRLTRLGRSGHAGWAGVLAAFRQRYIDAVASDRAGGAAEAAAEWDRSLARALRLTQVSRRPQRPCCSCEVAALRQRAASRSLFSRNPKARRSEQRVLALALDHADVTNSRVLDLAPRTIAVILDLDYRTVHAAFERLTVLGWMSPAERAALGFAGRHMLKPQTGRIALAKDGAGKRGGGGRHATPPRLHKLFGAGGLGPVRAEVLAQTPVLAIRQQRGVLVAIHPSTPKHLSLNDLISQPGLPRARLAARGTVVGDLTRRLGKDGSVTRRDLRALAEVGLGRVEGRRWSRPLFHADTLFVELGCEDTAARRSENYERDRLGFYRYMAEHRPHEVAESFADGVITFFSPGTRRIFHRHSCRDCPHPAGAENATQSEG